MEWISPIFNITIVIGLIGLLWRNINQKIDSNKRGLGYKQDKTMCDEKHLHVDEKLADIKETGDTNNKILNELKTQIALVSKAVNGG